MASSDVNRVNLIGNLTRDPEIKQIPSGTSICSFSIASNRVWLKNGEKQQDVSYFNCILWGKAGEALHKFAKKGQKVAVDGRLQQRRWQDSDGKNRSTIEVVVDNFQFLSFNNDSGENNSGGYPMPSTQEKTYPANGETPAFVEDNYIPF